MGELKTDLFPSNLYRAREEAKRKTESIAENSVQPAVSLPESEKTGKDVYNAGYLIPIKGSEDKVAEADRFMYTLSEKGVKTNSATFMAAEAVEGVTLTGETGILFGSVNSVMNGDKTVDQWYNESVDAVSKIAEANAKADK